MCDAAVPQAEIPTEDQGIWQIGFVVVPVSTAMHDHVTVLFVAALDHTGDIVAEELLVGPGPDCGVTKDDFEMVPLG